MYAILNILTGDYLYIGTAIHNGFIFSEEEVRTHCIDDVELALFPSKKDAEVIFCNTYWKSKDCRNGDSYVVMNGEEISLCSLKNRSLFEVIKINE
jgi:hypothetical protein